MEIVAWLRGDANYVLVLGTAHSRAPTKGETEMAILDNGTCTTCHVMTVDGDDPIFSDNDVTFTPHECK